MRCMIEYKVQGKYPFHPMTKNKKRAFCKNATNYKHDRGVLMVK